jgi:BON domain
MLKHAALAGVVVLALASPALAAAAPAAVAPAATAQVQAEPTDFQLFNAIAEKVLTYPRYTVFDDITGSVDHGVVTLKGEVTMPFKATDIARRVERVPGVKLVRNEIQVLPVSFFDDHLRYRIARLIYGNPEFWQYAIMANPPIHIIVDNGHVTLTGVVNSNVERMMARSLASSTSALSVTNDLKTDAEMKTILAKLH